jgi:multidrug efflux system membrane fusion protein
VGLRQVDVGNYVGTSDANGVAIITQLSPIDVQFAVPQDAAPQLQQQANALMPAQALDRTRSNVLDAGRFYSLDNQIDPQTGTVKAKARFDNAKLALFPSQFVNVRVDLQTIRGAIVVPVSAVRHGNDGEYVWLLNPDHTVTMRPVKPGQATVEKVQIVSGLKAGDRVITEGADRLREGARVVLPGDAPGGAGNWMGGASAPHGAASSSPRRRGASGARPRASGS